MVKRRKSIKPKKKIRRKTGIDAAKPGKDNKKGKGGNALTVVRKISEIKKARAKLEETERVLRKRVKELNCLYALCALVEEPGISLDAICQGMVNLIPTAWQHPDSTCARIDLEGRSFKSADYKTSKWKQSTDIMLRGSKAGTITVYSKHKPRHEARFLQDEKALLNAIAERLGKITERKKMEAEIAESERRFHDLAESLPQLVWTCDPEGPCDFLSRQWIEYTGIPEAEQLGYGWLKQLHPDDRGRTIEAWYEAVKKSADFDVEFRIRRKDGVYRWFKTRAIAMRDADGQVIKWFGFNTDIDDLKTAQEKVKLFSDAIAGAVDGIVIADAKGVITHANRAAEEMYGYKKGELTGKPAHVLNPRPEMFDEMMSTLLKTGRWNGEMEQIRKNKEVFHALLSLSSISNDKGKPIAMMCCTKDITELRKLRDEADKMKESAIIDAMIDGVVIADPNGNLIQCNTAYAQMFGLKSPNELKGMHLGDVVSEGDLERTMGEFAKCLETGGAISFEYFAKHRTGTEFPVVVNASAVKNDKGESIGVIGVIKDITESKRLSNELEARLKELEAFHDVAISRELAMIKLEEEVERLRNELAPVKGKK